MAGDMFPVRVMVETVRSQHCLGCAHDGNPLVDTFAVVGGQTMLSQLVETVLAALGLPQLVQDSKGLIQINGWKPISFETITDNPEELVINLFREISTHITLKILAKRSSSEPNGQCLVELKQKLLKTAIEKQPQILTTSNGQEVKEILQQVIQGDQECSTWTNREQTEAVNEWLEQMAAQQEDSRKSPCASTKFSPVSELPRLERWFRSDPNPSRQKLLNFINILNTSPYRRANNKVTYQQICNWFINQRRTAQRQNASRQPSLAQQQKMPLAMLPLNATGSTNVNGAPTQNNLIILNSLASALANGSMDSAQIQQKIATILAGMGEKVDHPHHQIPLAKGPPMDIRSKFDGTNINEHHPAENGTNGHQEGQQSSGQHSDRMDGGSESPTGNDFMSEESGSCEGGVGEIGDSIACSPDELFMDVQQQQNGPPEATSNTTITMNGERNNNGNAMDEGGEQDESGQHENLQQNVAQSALNFSQLLHQSSGHGHQQQTQQPPVMSAAAAAAAAAFQTLMPTQSQLHLMNQLAMASQLQQQQGLGMSPATPQPPQSSNPFGNGGRPNSTSGPSLLKSSPSSNSLMTLNREEANCAGINIKLEAGFSSPSNHNVNGGGTNGSQNGQNNGNGSSQSSRSRLMFDPLSELPILERWFEENPHPGWLQIEQYTDYLNSMAYRQNYPPISTHNVKIWFKNRRAKTKRLLGNNDCSIASTSAV